MTVFFTSDTHFGHQRIIELSNRPFRDVDHMNASIIYNWNSVVGPRDIVFHLGDVALGKIADSLPLVGQLNGTKFLVDGNHDRTFSENKASHRERFLPEYQKVFDEVMGEEGLSISLNGHKFYLSHFPYSGDSHGEERYTEQRPVDEGMTLIHGHTHEDKKISRSRKGTLQIHVGQDAWSYTPVPASVVLSLAKAHA